MITIMHILHHMVFLQQHWIFASYKCDLYQNLEKEEILRILAKASQDHNVLSIAPPVLPKEGELYIFDLGPDRSLWESNKRCVHS